MQTFLPENKFVCSKHSKTIGEPDNFSSLCLLDNKRLGKQRVEAFQILTILLEKKETGPWVHHPAVLMWKGYETALASYMNKCIDLWILRGFKNNMKYYSPYQGFIKSNTRFFSYILPPWYGIENFHRSHRQALLFKDYTYYKTFWTDEEPVINYWWPTQHGY